MGIAVIGEARTGSGRHSLAMACERPTLAV
jgi:hypothetical protein